MHMGMIITGIATEGCSFPNAVILTTSGRVCPEQSRRKESMRRQMCLSSYKFPNWICVSMIAERCTLRWLEKTAWILRCAQNDILPLSIGIT
jgi:hypothetical protein